LPGLKVKRLGSLVFVTVSELQRFMEEGASRTLE